MGIGIMLLSLFMILVGLNVIIINNKLDKLVELMAQSRLLELMAEEEEENDE